MKIRHIHSSDVWLLTRGNRVLYRGKDNPWRTPKIIAAVLRQDGKLPVQAA